MIISVRDSVRIVLDHKYRIIVLPFGSIEYHGETLPYYTDTVIAEKLLYSCLGEKSDRFDRDIGIYVYPAIPIGYSHEWMLYPGTVSIEPHIYIRMIYSIIDSIETNMKPSGYIFFNAHGGNYGVLHSAAKRLYMIYGKPFILIDVWRIASRHGLKYCHACSFEAELYNMLTGNTYSGVDEEYCRDEELSGVYRGYRPGRCGDIDVDVGSFVEEICGILSRAVEEIITSTKH